MTVLVDITEGPVYLLGWDPNRTARPPGVASGVSFGTAMTLTVVSPSGVAGSSTVGTVSTTAVSVPDGISAGPGVITQPSITVSVNPAGVAGTATVGDPQADAVAELSGIPTGIVFGVTEAFTSMNPTGFSAAGGGSGTPGTNATVNPAGIASGLQLGDVDTIATVFIIPGPIDPSNDFGDTRIIMRRLIFRPPTQTLGWGWYKRFEGISVLKVNGSWTEVPWPTIDETKDAEVYLPGGRDHAVSTTLAAELIAEGYTISEEL